MLSHLLALLSFLFRCARAIVLLSLVLLSDAFGFRPATRVLTQWEEWFRRLEHHGADSNCSNRSSSHLGDAQNARTAADGCTGVTGTTGVADGSSRVTGSAGPADGSVAMTAMAHRLCGRCVSSSSAALPAAFPAAKSAAFPAATHALHSHLSTTATSTSTSAPCRPSPAALHNSRAMANYPPPRGAKAWWYQPWLAHSVVTGARRLLPGGGGGGLGGAGAGGRRYVGTVPPAAGGRGVGMTRCEGGGSMYTWPDKTRPRVCILGGGFGGLYTALRLDSLLWTDEQRPQVLLVDQSERFVFKPLLYELLTQDVTVWEIAPKFSELLRSTGVTFLQDGVQAVDVGGHVADDSVSATGGRVRLASGVEVEYDWLVLALGARTNMAFAPGAKGRALPFSTLDDALAVDRRLLLLEKRWDAAKGEGGSTPPPIRVVVVGAGYAGVELACTVAERLGGRGTVEIVDPAAAVCPAAAAGNRRAAERALKERGVHLRLTSKVTSVADAAQSSSPSSFSTTHAQSTQPDTTPSHAADPSSSSSSSSADPSPFAVPASLLSLESVSPSSSKNQVEHQIEADIVLWTVGSSPVLPAVDSPAPAPAAPAAAAAAAGEAASQWLQRTARGQADVEESLQVKGLKRVFALGDAACVLDGNGRPLPATAQVAFQQADYVGWNIWAAINNRPLLPFRYQHLGELVLLGSKDAAASVGFIDDFLIEGRAAHTARKLAYLYRLPTNEHRARVGVSWLTRAIVDGISEAQNFIAAATNPQAESK
ncbi:hypothetical protein CLOP_g8614 [Closterium sp. NIES-67]|nr:hypothetical protein CLOP_g8614 [Closterium sp. NIES-67]